MLSQKFLASVAVIAMLAAPSYSNAQQILWDQQPDTTLTTVIDLDVPAPDDPFSTYLVNDATFGGPGIAGVNITSITSFYSNNNGAWENLITNGVLNIFDGDGLVAGDDPTAGGDLGPGSVAVDVVNLGNGVLAVTANNLNITLGTGTYFFGLSASLPNLSLIHI